MGSAVWLRPEPRGAEGPGASVAGVDDELEVTEECSIPVGELEWRFSTSGGPGGQHANRAQTRVEVRFDVERSKSLGESERERLLRELGPVVSVVADDERSQARNRALALERLRERLAAALRVPKRRRPTRPSPAAERRRLEEKRRRAERKQRRQPPTTDW